MSKEGKGVRVRFQNLSFLNGLTAYLRFVSTEYDLNVERWTDPRKRGR